MSRLIKMEAAKLNEVVANFAQWLRSARLTNGKIQFSTEVGKVDRKATLVFTGRAWIKMHYLVSFFQKECGWHFVARRSETEEDAYIVEDVLVYPQEVTASTVNTDYQTYGEWRDALSDDAFNNLRGHGHSHVNMGVTPSSVDIDHQDNILAGLPNDAFYIFIIANKKGDMNIRIFDYHKNIAFETADVEVFVESDGGFFDMMEDAVSKIKEKAWTYTNTKVVQSQTGGTQSSNLPATKQKAPVSTDTQTSAWVNNNAWMYGDLYGDYDT